MDPSITWIIIVFCLLGSFFFSAYETAIGLCNRFKMQLKADDGSRRAKLVLKLCDHYDRTISTVLIGYNALAVLLSSVSALAFYTKLNELGAFASQAIPIISSILVSLIVYVIGDTLPKTIAKCIPDTISYLFAYPLYFFYILLTPFSFVFERLVMLFDKLFKNRDETEFTEEDFETIVENVTDEGILEEEQGEIIASALDFADTNVKEVLTPREKIFAIDINNLSLDKLNEILVNTNFSRIPIYDRDLDNITGVLIVKMYFSNYLENPSSAIRKSIQRPYFVTNTIMIDDLFNGFKKNKTHIAIVKDNNSKVCGMVTMEDVLEELVNGIEEKVVSKNGGNR